VQLREDSIQLLVKTDKCLERQGYTCRQHTVDAAGDRLIGLSVPCDPIEHLRLNKSEFHMTQALRYADAREIRKQRPTLIAYSSQPHRNGPT
jgi:hypothetical protein